MTITDLAGRLEASWGSGAGRRPASNTRGERMAITGWSRAAADDIDDIAVERAMTGEHVPGLTCWERRHAVKRLRERGYSWPAIAAVLGIDQRQVGRDLQRFGMVGRREMAS